MASHEFAAYEGPENYIFVSYAHKDAEKVLPVMTALHDRGYRIWYDEGITPGSEWPENIAQHLNSCALFLAFVTPNSMASPNCRREINFALAKQKPFLSVFLEPTEMPLGMELQLSAQQSVLLYNFPTRERFIEKICGCPDMVCCLAAPEVPEEPVIPEEVPDLRQEGTAQEDIPADIPEERDAPADAPDAEEPPKKHRKNRTLTGVMIAALVLAVLSLALFWKPATEPAPEPADSFRVYVRIPDGWRAPYCWAWGEGVDVSEAWPGEIMVWNGSWYTVELPGWVIGVDISSGGIETGDIAVNGGTDLWVVVERDYWTSFFYEPTQQEIQAFLDQQS